LLLSENEGARRLIRRTGTSVRLVGRDAGTLSYEMELGPWVEPSHRRRLAITAPADCVGAA